MRGRPPRVGDDEDAQRVAVAEASPLLHLLERHPPLAPGGRSWHRGSMPPSSASRASHAASTSTVSARAALSAEALGLSGPTSSHLEGLASCAAISSASFFFWARCQLQMPIPLVSVDINIPGVLTCSTYLLYLITTYGTYLRKLGILILRLRRGRGPAE